MAEPTAEELLLLCHMEGADGATTMIDSSGNGNVFRFGVGAALSTEQSKFGDASLKCVGDTVGIVDVLLTDIFADWDFGSGDFTIDYWYRPITTAGGDTPISFHPSGNYHASHLHSNNNIFMEYSLNGSTLIQTDSGHNITDGVWTHFAYVRNGNNLDTYMNGVKGSTTKDVTGVTLHVLDTDALFRMGYFMNGYLDEVRISKNAVYTENFSVPTEPFAGPGGGGGSARTLTRGITRALTRGLTRSIGA